MENGSFKDKSNKAIFLNELLYILYYDRIDVSEGMLIKQVNQKSVMFCHYWCFLNCSLKFQPNLCNRCHDLLMISINLSDIAILNIKLSDYCCFTSLITINEAIKLLQKADLTEESGTL